MDFAHILIWITVGLVAAIAAGYVAVTVRNIRSRTKANPTEASLKEVMEAQTAVIEHALTKYETPTKTDLTDQTDIVKQAISDSAGKSNDT